MTKARKKLAEIDAKLAANTQSERALSERQRGAQDHVEEAEDALARATLDGRVGIDLSPADKEVEAMHGVLARARASADTRLFEKRRDGLHREKQRLES